MTAVIDEHLGGKLATIKRGHHICTSYRDDVFFLLSGDSAIRIKLMDVKVCDKLAEFNTKDPE